MTQPNRVAIALSSIFAGAAAGAAVATFCVWLSWRGWSFLGVFGDPRNIVFAANFVLSPLTAFVLCWRLSPAIDETWRRAAMAVTSAFGAFAAGWAAFPISMLSLMMANPILSNGLMPGYFLLMVVILVVALRIARRHRQPAGAALTA
jgi:hypothetical protein